MSIGQFFVVLGLFSTLGISKALIFGGLILRGLTFNAMVRTMKVGGGASAVIRNGKVESREIFLE